jgi:4'-phosphopantetheinyl transferase EntD
MDAAEISRLFAAPVSVALADPGAYTGFLFAQEAALVARAVDQRRREFTAGRVCARDALAQLGAAPGPILAGAAGEPIWPRGFVGSITHCQGFCGAVAAHARDAAALGLDAERADPLAADVARLVCSLPEIAGFAPLPPCPAESSWETLAFCAKEAFYKAYYALTAETLAFAEVSIRFTMDASTSEGGFDATIDAPAKPLAGRAFAGRWRLDGGLAHAGVSFAPVEPASAGAPTP